MEEIDRLTQNIRFSIVLKLIDDHPSFVLRPRLSYLIVRAEIDDEDDRTRFIEKSHSIDGIPGMSSDVGDVDHGDDRS